MRQFFFLLCTAALLQNGQAHYIFSKLIINDTLSADHQFIRDRTYTSQPPIWGKAFPLYNVSSPNMICGRDSFPVLNPSIETATVLAGSEAGFHLSGPLFPDDTPTYIYHPGPGQVFMSALPPNLQDLSDYDGSGDWFKIAYAGPKNDTEWSLAGEVEMRFTIPKKTPPGKYLMRIEQFMPDFQLGQSQWFISCAHVDVVGTGGGKPGPFMRFPGYSDEDPSIRFQDPSGQWGFPKNVSTYIMPKPDVWDGA